MNAIQIIINSDTRCVRPSRHRFERGFSLVTGIFILVILSALGVFMVTLSGINQQSSALDVAGSRAYHAARSGMEWGVYQVTSSPATTFVNNCVAAIPGAVSSPVALAGTLANFNVSVECAASRASEAGATVTLYQLTSTAATQGAASSVSYVERQVRATVGREE